MKHETVGKVFYECSSCNAKHAESSTQDIRPSSCSYCKQVGCMKVDSGRSVYGNFQKITLQGLKYLQFLKTNLFSFLILSIYPGPCIYSFNDSYLIFNCYFLMSFYYYCRCNNLILLANKQLFF